MASSTEVAGALPGWCRAGGHALCTNKLSLVSAICTIEEVEPIDPDYDPECTIFLIYLSTGYSTLSGLSQSTSVFFSLSR